MSLLLTQRPIRKIKPPIRQPTKVSDSKSKSGDSWLHAPWPKADSIKEKTHVWISLNSKSSVFSDRKMLLIRLSYFYLQHQWINHKKINFMDFNFEFLKLKVLNRNGKFLNKFSFFFGQIKVINYKLQEWDKYKKGKENADHITKKHSSQKFTIENV